MIRKANVPVIPCIVDGSYDAWPRTQSLPRLRPIRVEFGPPMKLDHLKSHAIVNEVSTTLHRMLDRVSLRGLRVLKYRGTGFAENEFPMVISPTGIEVSVFGQSELRYDVSTERIPTRTAIWAAR